MRMGMGESTKNFSAFFVVRGCTRVYEGVHAYMCVRALCDPKKFFLFFLRKLLTGDRMVCYNESSLKENEVKQNDKNTTYGNAC